VSGTENGGNAEDGVGDGDEDVENGDEEDAEEVVQ
jgi:hypothetical protein